MLTMMARYEEVVDRVACMANGGKYTWSESDKKEMRETAEKIIEVVAEYYFSDDDY